MHKPVVCEAKTMNTMVVAAKGEVLERRPIMDDMWRFRHSASQDLMSTLLRACSKEGNL